MVTIMLRDLKKVHVVAFPEQDLQGELECLEPIDHSLD